MVVSLQHIVRVLQDGHKGQHDSKLGYKLLLTPVPRVNGFPGSTEDKDMFLMSLPKVGLHI